VTLQKVIVRKIPRADPSVIAGLAEMGTATVHEAAGQTGLMSPAIRPLQNGAAIAGSAVTVLCPAGDNLILHASVEVLQPGDVLVIALTSPADHGAIGELLVTSFRAHGCVGLVAECGVRDHAEINALGFPVWGRVVHAQGTQKNLAGSVNVPIVCGGQAVAPGDVIVADNDGVCVIPRADAATVLAAARSRVEKEKSTRQHLQSGELGVDYYGFRQKIKDLGITYVDEAPREERG